MTTHKSKGNVFDGVIISDEKNISSLHYGENDTHTIKAENFLELA